MADIIVASLVQYLKEERKVFSRYESELYNIMMNRGLSHYDDEESFEDIEQEDGLEQAYRDRIELIFSGIMAAYEALGLNTKLVDLRSNIERIRKQEEGTFKFEYVPYWDYYRCEALDVLDRELNICSAIVNLLNQEDKTKSNNDAIILGARQKLIEYLQHTRFYVSKLFKGIPSSEMDIQNVMHPILEGFFGAEFHKNPPISQSIKSYEPDCGIKSIGTAVEFKFVDTEQELKTAMDGIYTDLSGYSGSKDWTQFISVFYMTDSFRSNKAIEEDIISKSQGKWLPVLVIGKGMRKGTPAKMKTTKKNTVK